MRVWQAADGLPADPDSRLSALLENKVSLNTDEFYAEIEPFLTAVAQFEPTGTDMSPVDFPNVFHAVYHNIPACCQFLKTEPVRNQPGDLGRGGGDGVYGAADLA